MIMSKRKAYRKISISLATVLLLSTGLAIPGIDSGALSVSAAEEKGSKVLSQEEAVRLAKKLVEIPDEYKLEYAYHATPENSVFEFPCWSIAWKAGEEQSVGVTIHSETGKLLGYSSQSAAASNEGPGKLLPQEKVRENVERFIARAVSDDERGKLSKPTEILNRKEGELSTYTFVYYWAENNIPFKESWFRVRANSRGEIETFKRNWYEGELPDAKLAIPEKTARETLEKGMEPSLSYLGKDDGKGSREYRLVYLYAKTDPQFVDAISGKVIDANGNEGNAKTERKTLETVAQASLPLPPSKPGGTITREQVEASAIQLVRSAFPGQLKDLYVAKQYGYFVEFGWLKDGIAIHDATFLVKVDPATGQANFADKENVRAPIIADSDPKRVDVSAVKQAALANNPLELVYYQPPGYDEKTLEDFPPRLIYRLVDDRVVDAHTGEWVKFD